MKRTVGICHQDFAKIRQENIFYVDKTKFIREWWEAKDEVTLITRPRRFGKTLNMIHRCRKHMLMVIGRSLLLLREVCLTRYLKQILIWNGP